MADKKLTTDDILRKYSSKIESQIKGYQPPTKFGRSYRQFRQTMSPEFSRYEKWCKALGNFFHIKVADKDRVRIEEDVEFAHLDLSPSEVVVFAVSVLFLSFFGGLLILVAGWLLVPGAGFPFFIMLLVMVFSIFVFYYAYTTPKRLAMQWRLKASSQMVPAILYVVIYMKHTSNFERAVAFAAEHLSAPLSLDFKKIFWDVEIGRFSSIKESVDYYLDKWKEYSMEFVESFHLIESSLYEPSEEGRIVILEKGLQVILDGVYDKMLKYTHEVKSPLTNIYMLGIILPTLSLAILPLASTMLAGLIQWYHVLVIFNVLIPFLVIYLTMNVMFQRPGGYGESRLLEKNPLYGKYKSNKGFLVAGLIVFPFFLLGILPILWTYTDLPLWLSLQRDYSWSQLGFGFLGDGGVFGILSDAGKVVAGPFGTLSIILSLFVPLSIAFFFIISYQMKTKELIKERDKYKDVEGEFTSSLFQLGNRLGDGIPAEIAFSKVADSSKGTATEGFFRIVNENIHNLGMSLEEALFNPRRGAVIFYPSELIATSMKILLESVKKGLKVAARSLMSISEYVKNIKKINDRLNDLLAEVISDMKSNMTFLAPLLAGIVIGLAGMITNILGSLSGLFESFGGGEDIIGAGGLENLLGIFDVELMIPTYWLQIVIGIYLVEIVFILTSTLVTIKSGKDKLQTTSQIAKNLKVSIVFYSIVAFVAVVALTLLGAVVLAGLG